MDVASRHNLDDVLIRTKFSSLRWTTDNRGIFYTTYAGALDNIGLNNNSTNGDESNGKTGEIDCNKKKDEVEIVLFF